MTEGGIYDKINRRLLWGNLRECTENGIGSEEMAKYVLKRVVMAVITLFIVTCLTFLLMNAIPGNPWLSEKTPSQATIDALNEKYGYSQSNH